MRTMIGAMALAVAVAAGVAHPQGEDGRPEGCHGEWPHDPPQVALDACESSGEGEACSFIAREGEEVAGTCVDSPQGLACMPEGFHGHRGPSGTES